MKGGLPTKRPDPKNPQIYVFQSDRFRPCPRGIFRVQEPNFGQTVIMPLSESPKESYIEWAANSGSGILDAGA